MKKLISRLAFFIPVSVFVVGSLFTSGCGSSQPQKTYYQLPVLTNAVAEKSALQEIKLGAKHEPQLWIKSVNLSDYLAAPGIVYQTGDVSYVNASNHLWASPLQQQLQQALSSELSAAFPNRLVSGQELEKDADALDVTITAFHGRYDGQVLIEGYWILSNSDKVVKRPFNFKLKQEKNGYAELVLTLSKGYSQLAKSIAKQLSLQS
ncbi:membrane integrity-associated transporter subunit PqiC [Xenorhabdus sp. XENO-10]|uniref:Membrane integrity-associated transporter subunit PqiC n=1 Tax=Xenorhabdus yunnanensis TaxID=3025878 RepID=A0ABT5LBF4_9GAMM|nr:membrane integrity-associated transporter subunit PqiC [Xenorhabdus yunnanensis]MDC9588397.1 membrane integrity-associated transporter subunit PqiC [Xenorhabdus yunnanensis]